jgi:hypothetical protein
MRSLRGLGMQMITELQTKACELASPTPSQFSGFKRSVVSGSEKSRDSGGLDET